MLILHFFLFGNQIFLIIALLDFPIKTIDIYRKIAFTVK